MIDLLPPISAPLTNITKNIKGAEISPRALIFYEPPEPGDVFGRFDDELS